MGRPALFDRQCLLKSVLETFWQKGFEKTSFADLEKSSGVKKMTLFREFGNKENLFLSALEQYHDETRQYFEQALELNSPLLSIEVILDRPISIATGKRCVYGCFHANSIVECNSDNPEVKRIVRDQQKKVRDLLIGILKKGQESGEIRSDMNAGQLADYIICSIYGIVVGGKNQVSSGSIRCMKTLIIDAIGK